VLDLRVDPSISPSQLYAFYQRNNICEAGYTMERAAVVLAHPSIIVAAFDGEQLVAIARAVTDGLAAAIMEFSIDLRFQGTTPHANGSLVEADPEGVGARLGKLLLDELARREIDFISAYVVENSEEPFYKALGFRHNAGHAVYMIDKRPY
jgi:hypothetical protein